jgi:RNA polymerase sigma-70 factor (ECF subfamily)
MNSEDSISTRETLLERLRQWDDHASWQEFFDTYWSLIHRFSLRAGLSEEQAREVVQDTVISVARNIPEFRYDPKSCTFKTWLLNVAKWRILDQRKKMFRDRQHSELEGSGCPEQFSAELESIWDHEWRNHLLKEATRRVKELVTPKQYQMFYLNALKDLPVREVAKRVGASAAAVYMARHRVGRLLKRELKSLQSKLA